MDIRGTKKVMALLSLTACVSLTGLVNPCLFTDNNIAYAADSAGDYTVYEPIKIKATVTADALKVRKGAGTTYAQKVVAGTPVTLKENTKVYVTGNKNDKDGNKWYAIKYKINNKWYTGYAISSYIKLSASKTNKVKAEITAKKGVYARTKAVSSGSILKYKKQRVALTYGQKCQIIGETGEEEKYFLIAFYYNKKLMTGYVKSDKLQLRKTIDEAATEAARQAAEAGKDNTKENTGSETNENNTSSGDKNVNKGSGTSENNTGNNTGTASGSAVAPEPVITTSPAVTPATPTTALSDSEFEAAMTAAGFPESYKPYLRELHSKHPYWTFEANLLPMTWDEAVANESKVGVNLIPNSKNAAWKSTAEGAYDPLTDKYIPYDGSTWVTASEQAVKYYMDPRNWLTEDYVYQFELLSYKAGLQTISGVQAILAGTAMDGTSYSYTDDMGTTVTRTYADTFMDAAAYSGVSPYHLATRSKQEVLGGSGFTSSVSGTVSGYEGLYNFYNIGAYGSTTAGGAVAHGLTYASVGNVNKVYYDGTPLNRRILIPWTNQYRAILGGAAYIGYEYIDRGQNTVYLQKFNMTAKSTYGHQYMTNIEVGRGESVKTKTAYSSLGEQPLVFSIPVYKDMPTTAAAMPGTGGASETKDFNNYLSSLTVSNYTLTPTFSPEVTEYTVVPAENDVSVTVSATAVSGKSVVEGTGEHVLVRGVNTIQVIVTAENGSQRVYTVTLQK